MIRIMSSISARNCAFGASASDGPDSTLVATAAAASLLPLGDAAGLLALLEDAELALERRSLRQPLPPVRGPTGGGGDADDDASLAPCARCGVKCDAGMDPNHDTRFFSGGERCGACS